MKQLIGLISMLALIAQANDGLRTFTASDGRSLEARILHYDNHSGKVQIERADKKKITVPATAFTDKDRAYIKSWYAAQMFGSTSKFKLELERDEADNSKKEHEVDFGEEFGGGRRGGPTGIQTAAIDKNTKYKFHLTLENKSDIPLKVYLMEYRIYYEQEKAVLDEKANKGRSEGDPRPERHMPLAEQKVKDGKARIGTIAPGETKTVSTGSITITKRSANRPWGKYIDLKGTVSGAWIRLTAKGPNGEKIVREISSPESIMKKFPWDVPEEEQAEEQPTE